MPERNRPENKYANHGEREMVNMKMVAGAWVGATFIAALTLFGFIQSSVYSRVEGNKLEQRVDRSEQRVEKKLDQIDRKIDFIIKALPGG